MSPPVPFVETFIVKIPRDEPYVGPLDACETANPRGYVVRPGKGALSPTADRSVVVRVTAGDDAVGRARPTDHAERVV